MSSTRSNDNQLLRAIAIACSLVLSLAMSLAINTSDARAAAAKLPKITKVSPTKDVAIGAQLKLSGKNFVKGKKTVIVMFRRDGSKRNFTARGNASSTTRAVVKVPDVSGDLVRLTQTTGGPLDNMYRLRVITKFGAAKAWTSTSVSPKIAAQSGGVIPDDKGPSGDCDKDGVRNGVDADDDDDLLEDAIESSIGTDLCNPDTDRDDASDYYEYRVAFEYNGGPVLPYPGLRPYPNPLVADSSTDFDGDGLTTHGEYRAWQFTGKMSRFYSDADQDSDDNGVIDGQEDEDLDKLPNYVELTAFQSGSPVRDLNWLKRDTDGDGLCDGLDDQDHDGPPTPLALADCTTPVPNNTTGPGFDPNPSLIDGDDNVYSNFYEWYLGGALPSSPGAAYEPCFPSIYPISPFCPADWDPLPVLEPLP